MIVHIFRELRGILHICAAQSKNIYSDQRLLNIQECVCIFRCLVEVTSIKEVACVRLLNTQRSHEKTPCMQRTRIYAREKYSNIREKGRERKIFRSTDPRSCESIRTQSIHIVFFYSNDAKM